MCVLAAIKAIEAHDLQPALYDKTLFKLIESSLFVTTQADNFIFAGTRKAMKEFSKYMSSCFELSELDFDNFEVYGTVFSRNESGHERIREVCEFLF